MCFTEDSLPAADAEQDETEDDGSEDNEECVGRARERAEEDQGKNVGTAE